MISWRKSRGCFLARTARSMPWTAEEEDKLRQIIATHGARRWNAIAALMNEGAAAGSEAKTAKQCRRRYSGHLTKEIKEHEWTREEDDALLEAHERLGNKWTEIARIVGGRTDNGAKNRYTALVQKLGASKRRRRASGVWASTSPSKASQPKSPSRRGKATPKGKKRSAEDRGDEDVAGGGRRRAKTPTTNGANGVGGEEAIPPTLFMSSPTNSAGAMERAASWRPTLSINVPSTGTANGTRASPFKPAASLSGLLPATYSIGKTLSLSCAELDLLKEVQEMISPRVMAANSPGGSNGSAFVRFSEGASGKDPGERSAATKDVQHVMNWLLSATPATTRGDAQAGPSKSAGGARGDSFTVSLAPNEDGSEAVERGATLKHFLSLKTEATSPTLARSRSGMDAMQRVISIPSFTQSELNLLLNALGGSAQPSPRATSTEPSRAGREMRPRRSRS